MVYFMDASGKAIGAYDFFSGRTWNFTINHLEFLTRIVVLLLAKMNGSLLDQHVLLWVDNMAAVCWIK